MVHSRILLNDGSSAILLNDGTSFLLLNTEGPAHVAAVTKKSISHVTLDAGVDLKRAEERRKPRSRYSQELMLSTEIETRARFIMPLTTTVKTTKTMFEALESKFRTKAKFLVDLIQQKRTVVTKFDPVSVRIPTKARFSFDKIINTLKDYLDIDK